MVWEYYLAGCYLDAVWFPEANGRENEASGLRAAARFPIAVVPVVLCEAKLRLTPELIGQALVYGAFARRIGANVRSIVIFAETARGSDLKAAAEDLGLTVVLPQSLPPAEHERA